MPHSFLQEWMDDFEKVGAALSRESSYVASLARSMSLAMEEFYRNIRSVGVSAVTGQGCEDFEKALAEAAEEFHNQYVPFLLEQRRDIEEKREAAIQDQLRALDSGITRGKRPREGPSMDDLEGDLRDFSIQER